MLRRISLANKCLLLFGLAVVLIILAALSVPWVRMNQLIDDAELSSCRQIAAAWEAAERRPAATPGSFTSTVRPGLAAGDRINVEETKAVIYSAEQVAAVREANPFLMSAWDRLTADPKLQEVSEVKWHPYTRDYRYAKAVRSAAAPGAKLELMMVLERESAAAGRSVLLNTGFLVSAGFVALGLAVLVFYLITNKIILSPVRRLRETAEIVRSGALDQRSDIHTGDEFEDLAESFNEMLTNVQTKQEQLRTLNAALEDKMTELEQRNQSLYEAARLKGDFLANVSHELRTPMNSIIGFAELLDEQIKRDEEQGAETAAQGLPRRRRYVENILGAGRALLDLINGLLEMAKVEAGKMELNISPMNLKESCETMLAMMKPLADKRNVELRFETPPPGIESTDMDPVYTDARKFQQILYNLISNAIKFTADAADAREAQMAAMDPEAAAKLSRLALVTLRAERLISRGEGSGEEAEARQFIRISVLDTGPGIKPEDQARIFEKFTQLDSGLHRKHAGTGLGLSIVKELTQLLQGEVQVESQVGRGAMFSVILPMRLNPERTAETKLELGLRGALAGQKS